MKRQELKNAGLTPEEINIISDLCYKYGGPIIAEDNYNKAYCYEVKKCLKIFAGVKKYKPEYKPHVPIILEKLRVAKLKPRTDPTESIIKYSSEQKELKDIDLTKEDIQMMVAIFNRYTIGPVADINTYNYIVYDEMKRNLKQFINSKNAKPEYKEQAANLLEKLV